MMRFLTLAVLLICIKMNAQVPGIEWSKCLGSNFSDYASCVQPTSDGGFIVSGYSTGLDNGDVLGHHGNYTVGDVWVVKLDKSGAIEWQKSLGGTDSEAGGFIIQTPDGGYILAGGAASRDCEMTGNHGGFDFWVVKLSSKGDMVWQKMYGGSKEDFANAITANADGTYYIAGYTISSDGDVTGYHGSGALDCWVIKIDAAGNLLWQKTLGGSDFDNARSVQSTADGGCILAGSTSSSDGDVTGNHMYGDYWVVKLDKNGNIQWQKALGGSMTEEAFSVLVTKDGGYLVSGYANSHDGDVTGVHGGSYDAWLVKLDAAGNIIWQKAYGGSSNETANNIQNTPDGGYVFTGASWSADGDIACNAGQNDVLVMKINSAGDLQWQKTMGGSAADEGYFIQPLNDGSYIVAATTTSPGIPGYHMPFGSGIYDEPFDYWVIKLSPPVATPVAPVVKIDPATAIVCAGKKATIAASVVNGGVNPVYQWTKNGMPAGTNSPLYTEPNFNDNDLVTCTVKNGSACENPGLQGTDAIVIKLKKSAQSPGITISADNTLACNCTMITIKATVANAGGAPFYQWMINGNNAGSNGPLLISNHLKDGDVITCSYTDNTSCAGNILSNAITMGGDNGGTASVTIAAAADTVCKGATASFTASAVNAGASPVYQWKINNKNAGANDPVFSSAALADGDIISCAIKADPQFACNMGAGANSNNVTIHVLSKLTPVINITASATTICAGSPVVFTATATGAGSNPVYQWKINGANAGTNNKTFSSAALVNNDAVSCVLSVDPNYTTCAVASQVFSENIPITVTSGTIPSVAITADRNNVCAGENITFTAAASNAGTNPIYQWLLNNAQVQNTGAVYTSKQLANGDRLVCRMVPGAGACLADPDSSNTIVALIKETPVVLVSPADTAIAPGKQVQLIAQVTGSIISFLWEPADKLINPLSLNPQTTIINENTNYTLTVANDIGCKASATAIIKIGTELYMPNAFTPNDDHVNDVFRIPPNVIIDLKEFSIYDRWGNKVFTTANKNAGWNGTINGKKQNTSSYVYYISGMINNKKIVQKGSFILVN